MMDSGLWMHLFRMIIFCTWWLGFGLVSLTFRGFFAEAIQHLEFWILMDIGWMDDFPHFLAFDGLSDMFDGHLGSGSGAVPTIYVIYYSEVFCLQNFHIQVLDVVRQFFLSVGFLTVFLCVNMWELHSLRTSQGWSFDLAEDIRFFCSFLLAHWISKLFQDMGCVRLATNSLLIRICFHWFGFTSVTTQRISDSFDAQWVFRI
jgi:hypothetical protein